MNSYELWKSRPGPAAPVPAYSPRGNSSLLAAATELQGSWLRYPCHGTHAELIVQYKRFDM